MQFCFCAKILLTLKWSGNGSKDKWAKQKKNKWRHKILHLWMEWQHAYFRRSSVMNERGFFLWPSSDVYGRPGGVVWSVRVIHAFSNIIIRTLVISPRADLACSSTPKSKRPIGAIGENIPLAFACRQNLYRMFCVCTLNIMLRLLDYNEQRPNAETEQEKGTWATSVFGEWVHLYTHNRYYYYYFRLWKSIAFYLIHLSAFAKSVSRFGIKSE